MHILRQIWKFIRKDVPGWLQALAAFAAAMIAIYSLSRVSPIIVNVYPSTISPLSSPSAIAPAIPPPTSAPVTLLTKAFKTSVATNTTDVQDANGCAALVTTRTGQLACILKLSWPLEINLATGEVINLANLKRIDFGTRSSNWAPSEIEGVPPKGTWPVTLTLFDQTTLSGNLGLDGGDPFEVKGDTDLGTYQKSYTDLSSIMLLPKYLASVTKLPPIPGVHFTIKTRVGDTIQAFDLFWQKRCSGDNQRREIPVDGGLRIDHAIITKAEFFEGQAAGQLSVRVTTIYGKSAVYSFDFGNCPRNSWLLFGETELGRLHLSINMVSTLESASVAGTPAPEPASPSPGPYDYGPSGKLLTRDGRLFEIRNLNVTDYGGLQLEDGIQIDLKKASKMEFQVGNDGKNLVVVTGVNGKIVTGVVLKGTVITARIVLGRIELPVQEISEIQIYP